MTTMSDSRSPSIGIGQQHIQRLQHAISKVMVGGRPRSAKNKNHHAVSATPSIGSVGETQQSPSKYHPGYVSAVGRFAKKRRGANEGGASEGGPGNSGVYDANGQHHQSAGSDHESSAVNAGLQDNDSGRESPALDESWLGKVASEGRSHFAQLEQELETELPQTDGSVEERQIPEPRHVKYATVMARNLRHISLRATTPRGTRRHSAGAQMTPEEQRELTRAQREVMWNLQREGVVTVVRPGDEPVPYKRQGNPAVNTPQSVRRRQALRKRPLIQEISNEYWCFPGLHPEGSVQMSKDSYMQLNRKLHLALVPDTTDEEARWSAELDWLRDTKRWGGRMPKEAFFSSMFELADIWTENINEEEYTAFLWLLLETVTDSSVVPPSFKPDRDIECIIDKDLSEAAARIRSAVADGDVRKERALPIDILSAAAALASNRGGENTSNELMSPKLKEKHVERLRALRQRLQALKQLRMGSPVERENTEQDVGSSGTPRAKGGDGSWCSSEDGEAPESLLMKKREITVASRTAGEGGTGNKGDSNHRAGDTNQETKDLGAASGSEARDFGHALSGEQAMENSGSNRNQELSNAPPLVLGNIFSPNRGRQPAWQNRAVNQSSRISKDERLQVDDPVYTQRTDRRARSGSSNRGERHASTLMGNIVRPSSVPEADLPSAAPTSAISVNETRAKRADLKTPHGHLSDKEGANDSTTFPALGQAIDARDPETFDPLTGSDDFPDDRSRRSATDNAAAQVGTSSVSQNAGIAHQGSCSENRNNERVLHKTNDDTQLVHVDRTYGSIAPQTTGDSTDPTENTGNVHKAARRRESISQIPGISAEVRNGDAVFDVGSIGSTQQNSHENPRARTLVGGDDSPGELGQTRAMQTVPGDSGASESGAMPERVKVDSAHRTGAGASGRGIGGETDGRDPKTGDDLQNRGGGLGDEIGGYSGVGRKREEVKEQAIADQLNNSLDEDRQYDVLLGGSGLLNSDALSTVESSVSGDWMTELTKDEEEKKANEVKGEAKERATRGEPKRNTDRKDEQRSGKTAGQGGDFDTIKHPNGRRQEQQSKGSESGSAKRSDEKMGSNRRSNTSKPDHSNGSHFRPAGGNGGWDGITGTTDEAWGRMIEQAREERRAAFSRSQTRRAEARKRATTSRGTGVRRRSVRSSSPAAAHPAPIAQGGQKPNAPQSPEGRGRSSKETISSQMEDGQFQGSKKRISTDRRDYQDATGGHTRPVKPDKRQRVGNDAIDTGSREAGGARHGRYEVEETDDRHHDQEPISSGPGNNGNYFMLTRNATTEEDELKWLTEDASDERTERVGRRASAGRDTKTREPRVHTADSTSPADLTAARPETALGSCRSINTLRGAGTTYIDSNKKSWLHDVGTTQIPLSNVVVPLDGRSPTDGTDPAQKKRPEIFGAHDLYDRTGLSINRNRECQRHSGSRELATDQEAYDLDNVQREDGRSGFVTAAGLRVPQEAVGPLIDRLQDVLAKHELILADVLDGEPTSWIEATESISTRAAYDMLRAGIVSPQHGSADAHNAARTTTDGVSSDGQDVVATGLSHPNKLLLTSVRPGGKPNRNDRQSVFSNMFSADVFGTRGSAESSSSRIAILADAGSEKNKSHGCNGSTRFGNGRNSGTNAAADVDRTNCVVHSDGNFLKTGESQPDAPDTRDSALKQGQPFPSSMGMLFFSSVGGVVGGTTNELPLKAHDSTDNGERSTPSYERSHVHQRGTDDVGPLQAATIDDMSPINVSTEPEAHDATQTETGERGVQDQDLVVDPTPWGSSPLIAMPRPETACGSGKGAVDHKHAGEFGERVVADTICPSITVASVVVQSQVFAGGIQSSPSATVSAAGQPLSPQRSVIEGDFIVRTEGRFTGANLDVNKDRERGKNGRLHGRDSNARHQETDIRVDRSEGTTAAHNAGTKEFKMDTSPIQVEHDNHTFVSRRASPDDTGARGNTANENTCDGVLSSAVLSMSEALPNVIQRRTRSGSRTGAILCGMLQAHDGNANETETTLGPLPMALASEAATTEILDAVQGSRPQSQTSAPSASRISSLENARKPPVSDSRDSAACGGEGDTKRTNIAESAAGALIESDQALVASGMYATSNGSLHQTLHGVEVTSGVRASPPGREGSSFSWSKAFSVVPRSKDSSIPVVASLHSDREGLETSRNGCVDVVTNDKIREDEGKFISLKEESERPTTTSVSLRDATECLTAGTNMSNSDRHLAPCTGTTGFKRSSADANDRRAFGPDKSMHEHRQGMKKRDGSSDDFSKPVPLSSASTSGVSLGCELEASTRKHLDEIDGLERATAAVEQTGQLAVADGRRAWDDDLASTLAIKIARAGGADFDDVLAEVRRALSGLGDSNVATVKGSAQTKDASIAEKALFLGRSAQRDGRQDEVSREGNADANIFSGYTRGQISRASKPREQNLDHSKKSISNDRTGQRIGPRQSRPTSSKDRAQQQTRTLLAAGTITPARHHSLVSWMQADRSYDWGSQPALETGSSTSRTKDDKRTKDTTRSRSLTQHERIELDGKRPTALDSSPRSAASDHAYALSGEPFDQKRSPGRRIAESSARRETARREGRDGGSGRRPWRSQYIEDTASLENARNPHSRRHIHPKNRSHDVFVERETGAGGAPGGKKMEREGWVDDAYHTSRRRTADNSESFLEDGQRRMKVDGNSRDGDGPRGNSGNRRRGESEGVTKDNNDLTRGQSQQLDDDEKRVGDRYYLSPPQPIDRPRTSPTKSVQDHGDNGGSRTTQRKPLPDGQEQRLNRRRDSASTKLSDRNGGSTGSPGYSSTESRRSRRTSFSNGGSLNERPEDNRTMLWRSGAPESSYFGWRDPYMEKPTVHDDDEERPQPYYLDPKQVRHYVPTLGLPPWRTPAPGEPGWEPILNYCEVKRDEAETAEERRRRDYVVRRRRESSRDGGGSNEGSSSVSGGSGSSLSLSASNRLVGSTAGALPDSAEKEEETEGDYSVAGTALARRVNAAQRHRPASTLPASAEGHQNDAGRPNENDQRATSNTGKIAVARLNDHRISLDEEEDLRSRSSAQYQKGDMDTERTVERATLSGHVVKVADLARRTSQTEAAVANTGRVYSMMAHNHATVPRRHENDVTINQALEREKLTQTGPIVQSVPNLVKSDPFQGSPQGPNGQLVNTKLVLHSSGDKDNLSLLSSERKRGCEREENSRENVNHGAAATSSPPRAERGLASYYSPPAANKNANHNRENEGAGLTARKVLLETSQEKPSAVVSLPLSPLRQPLTSGSTTVGYRRSLLPIAGAMAALATASESKGANFEVLPLPGATIPATVIMKGDKELMNLPSNDGQCPQTSRRWSNNRRSSITAASFSTAPLANPSGNIPGTRDTVSAGSRRRSLPSTALDESFEHRRRSELLLKRIAAINAATPVISRRSRTSIPGSRSAQGMLVRQHNDGRSRLAPATRTAGGRWRATHGRLESLLNGEGGTPTVATSSVVPRREGRESGQWVLDPDLQLLEIAQDDIQYPLFQ